MFAVTASSIASKVSSRNVVVFVEEDKFSFLPLSKKLDGAVKKKITNVLEMQNFKASKGKSTALFGLDGDGVDNVVVGGVGKAKELIREDWVHFG
ncbi:MAG: hypothetical protein OXQ96_02145, partial [Alphaproteobacteria bacterium]|nr:hypothetical protein [Alphaproteobacteria bacterium]